MPRCQGRPDSDCPHDADDDSVRFTQGDLFLCPDCEEYRFPSTSYAKGGSRKGNRKHVQLGAKSKADAHQIDRNTMRPVTSTKQPLIEPVTGACRACNCIAPDKSAELRCDTCQGIFHGECLGIDQQTLVKFADIVHVTGWVCVACRNLVRDQLNVLHAGQCSLTDTVEQLKTDVLKLQQEITSVAKVHEGTAHHAANWPSLPVSKEQKKQLLAVVHKDFDDSRRRQCNVIVSGMAPENGVDDVDLFVSICENNLTVKPYVVRNKCRRLGRPQPGKIQPLLIRLNNADAAADMLKAAKQLRRSDNETVRRQVYINPDLTPGEAQAAFERRLIRRQRLQRQEAAANSPVEISGRVATVQSGADVAQSSRVDSCDTYGDIHAVTATDDTDSSAKLRASVSTRPLRADAAPYTAIGRVPSVS